MNPDIEIGSFVVLTGKNPEHWYMGEVKTITGDSFTFKVLEAYNEEMHGSTFIGNVAEIEFVENA